MFITFEGPEGAGKTTQSRLLAEALRAVGHDVVTTYEPGGTAAGEAIRRILLTPEAGRPLAATTEALLFNAARAQLVEEVIRPALARGAIVLCDRFSDSTLAYQVGGRGLPAAAVSAVIDFATTGLQPDLTILLDLDVAAGLTRKRGGPVDRLEREEAVFHQRVRAAYRAIAQQEPGRVVLLDAARSVEDLAAEIRQIVSARLRRARSP